MEWWISGIGIHGPFRPFELLGKIALLEPPGHLDRGRAEFSPRNHTKNIDYVQSAADTQIVGRAVAYMFNELKKAGWSDSQFECVGHSLGGQACGYAGSYAKSAFRINVGK